MEENKSFLSIFDSIKNCNYVVLRNYESFLSEGTLEEHPDVDILAENPAQLVQALSLEKRKKKEDGIHYKMKWNDRWVAFDLRTIGDGYYDSAWERKLLEGRCELENFYVLNEEDYFYSLLYHATVQKHQISEDYIERLTLMGDKLGIAFTVEQAYKIINDYLRSNGYKYTYPVRPNTIFRLDGADSDLIEINKSAKTKRDRYNFFNKIRKKIRGR